MLKINDENLTQLVSQYSATLVPILLVLPPPSQFSFYTCTCNTDHWIPVDGIEGINVLHDIPSSTAVGLNEISSCL